VSQTITLAVPPQANHRLRIGKTRDGKVRLFSTGEVKKYKKDQSQMLAFLKPAPKGHDVKVEVVWHMKKGDKGDLDNRLKVLLDTLKGAAYADDVQVAQLAVSRIKGAKWQKMVVTITDLGEGGAE
jgi:Holliday junction resolvase RusA-like endonuclease